MARTVTLALLITVLTVGSVALASMLPDMPSLIPVDGPTDQPVDAATCEIIGCSPADLTGTDFQPGAIP